MILASSIKTNELTCKLHNGTSEFALKKKSDGLNFDVDINQVKEGQPNSI